MISAAAILLIPLLQQIHSYDVVNLAGGELRCVFYVKEFPNIHWAIDVAPALWESELPSSWEIYDANWVLPCGRDERIRPIFGRVPSDYEILQEYMLGSGISEQKMNTTMDSYANHVVNRNGQLDFFVKDGWLIFKLKAGDMPVLNLDQSAEKAED